MTPFTNPRSAAEERYNRSHARTRVVVEQTFGVLKSRFRCLHQSGGTLQYEPKKCAQIAAACMLLHNSCVKRRIPVPNIDMFDNDGDIQYPPARDDAQAPGHTVRRDLVNTWFS